MKKFYILINLLLFITPVLAQESSSMSGNRDNKAVSINVGGLDREQAPQMIDGQKLETYLRTYFKDQKISQGQSKKKKWQVIYVMNATATTTEGSYLKWGALDDNRKEIERQIAKGNISRAVLLYSRPDGTTYMDVFPRRADAVRYASINYSDTPEIQYTQIDTTAVSEEQILKQLFSGFASQGYYTAVILNLHGGGSRMISFIGGQHVIYPKTYIKPIRESGLVVNLLAWNSCLMGTIGNIYEMTEYTNVEYIIASSNLGLNPQRVGKGERAGSRGAHPLLKLLGVPPKEAGQKFVAKFSVTINPSVDGTADPQGNIKGAMNAMFVDAQFFREKVSPYLEQLMEKFGSDNLSQLTSGKEVGSFNQMLSKLNRSLLKRMENAQKENKFRQGKDNIQSLQKLVSSLLTKTRQTILVYRCNEMSAGIVRQSPEDVPEGSDCIDGFSVDLLAMQKIEAYVARKNADQQSMRQAVQESFQEPKSAAK